jgi:hypothetical protein
MFLAVVIAEVECDDEVYIGRCFGICWEAAEWIVELENFEFVEFSER